MIRRLLSWWPDGPMAAGLLLVAGVVLAFAPDPFLLMLARAFLWQWAIAFGVIALWNLRARRWWTVTAALISALLTAMPPERTVQAPCEAGTPSLLRVAQMNVFQPNDDHGSVIAAALASDADVISFQEVSPAWAGVLVNGMSATHPHHRLMPGNNCYGIALFSKQPFLRADVSSLNGRPMVDAVVATAHGPVRILSVHATSPGAYAEFKERNRQLDRLAGIVQSSPLPTVLVGDLNTVSWDRALVRLCERTGLREHAGNVTATWPSALGLALIPLDHVLVTPHIAVGAIRSFPIPGSDHRGILAEIRARS